MLSQSLRVVIYLPVGDDLWEHVSAAQVLALPSTAVSSESLLRVADSPAHLDLKTLYGGKGGRIVPPSETFGRPVRTGWPLRQNGITVRHGFTSDQEKYPYVSPTRVRR